MALREARIIRTSIVQNLFKTTCKEKKIIHKTTKEKRKKKVVWKQTTIEEETPQFYVLFYFVCFCFFSSLDFIKDIEFTSQLFSTYKNSKLIFTYIQWNRYIHFFYVYHIYSFFCFYLECHSVFPSFSCR